MFNDCQYKPKYVMDCENDDSRKVVLIDKQHTTSSVITSMEDAKIREVSVPLTYKNWSASQVIRSFLADSIPDTDVVSGFEIVGHIAHLNLKDFHEPYKFMIGQVILDKNPSIKTVVNKLNSIHSKYRFFDMEVLAGEDNFITTAIEHKIKFSMDFSKVYWNSKLGTEHRRVVDAIPVGATVLDMFCGIGPFALPLARKRCHVHANDLNPESYKWLVKNRDLNGIGTKLLTCYNMDGRDFVREFSGGEIQYVLMNLPASATEFLDVFVGLYSVEKASQCPIKVFCYHFAPVDSPEESTLEAVREVLGAEPEKPSVHLVRKTAPKTWMTCVEFVVPESVLRGENQTKRTKTE